MRPTLTLLAAVLLAPPLARAAVTGRIVRFEGPASGTMAVYEIEAWCGGRNIALGNKELKVAGISYRGRDINERREWVRLVDGKADFAQRGNATGMEFSMPEEEVNPWFEMDFGRDVPLEKIVVSQPLKPTYQDRAIRLVTVLDAGRRVVWSGHYDTRRPPCLKGVATFSLAPGKGPLVGRTVPAGTAQWVPLGDVLEAQAASVPPDAAERARRFAERDSPAAIALLAKEFFARADLAKPELASIRATYERGDHAAALDAYRDHFLAKLEHVTFMHEGDPVRTPYAAAAEDLLRGIAVVFARYDAAARTFRPGVIDWAAIPDADHGGIDLARVTARAGRLPWPLLEAYRRTGRADFARQWAAICDDWGMNIRGDLARAKEDLRFYFVKDVLQEFNHLADELAQTARQRPDIGRQVSGATLARLLIPVLEEYPPAYWWVCRRASFNHTYNALDAATITARVLDDFHAGQRLDRENREHWQRVWTTMMTRDGSMNEIGDEGHMFMQLRMGAFFRQMQLAPPPWFTPDFAAEFQTGWRMTTAYPFRHLCPDGRGHRMTRREHFDYLWNIIEGRGDAYFGSDPLQRDAAALPPPPEVVSIVQSVFGAGRDRAALSPPRQEIWDKVTGRFGTKFTPPAAASDWMPYAGLHYLRRSWEPDATFIHMLSQPKGHPGTNGSDWNTEVHLFDYGQPLLALSPVSIDGQPPFNEAGTLTYKPGSKTEVLAVASPRPMPARWHTSALCDYAESFYEGTYQRHQAQFDREYRTGGGRLVLDDLKIDGARADRRVILLRPARLVIVTDAVRAPRGGKPHTFEVRERFAIPETSATAGHGKKRAGDGPAAAGKFQGDARTLTLTNEGLPGVAVHRFTTAKLAWNPRGTPDAWDGATMANHQGAIERLGGLLRAEPRGDLLMSALVEPQPRPGASVVQSTRDRSSDDITGFTATLADGAVLTWLATRGEARTLTADAVTLEGDGLLVWQDKQGTCGLALGAKSLALGGRPVALSSADFEFCLKDGRLASTTPIYRPIEPVLFSPPETVFTRSAQVVLRSATPGVEIRYTLDGAEPGPASSLYTAPLTISQDAFIRARAFRPGVKAIPFTTAGTDVTVVSDARFYRRDLRPAAAAATLVPGLRWELVEADWHVLFSHLQLPEVTPAAVSGQTARLLDVSMRRQDGPFGVRYSGYLEVPADGVWTFHAPAEYVGASCEPGYDLRLWIDGQEWSLGQRFHGQGRWSVALAKGPHRLLVTFADARGRDRTVHEPGLWRGYPSSWVVWKGEAPVIQISGPGAERQPIPAAWLKRTP